MGKKKLPKIVVVLIVVAALALAVFLAYDHILPLFETERTLQATPEQMAEQAAQASPVAVPAPMPAALPEWCKDIRALSADYYAEIPGDASGKLRELRIYEGAEIPYYVLSYYRYYFDADDEVHYIIDASAASDTWRICRDGDVLRVERHAPVTGEDRSAEMLGSGELVAIYEVSAADGAVTQTYGERYEETAPDGSGADSGEAQLYVGNTATGVFHLYGCLDAERISIEQKVVIYDTRDGMIRRGYSPCQHCRP